MSKSEIICVDCKDKTNCTTYKVLENTLDSKKQHYKFDISLSFLITANNPTEFREDFQEDIIMQIAEQAAKLAIVTTETISEYECDVQHLGAESTVESIENKEAFKLISDYIKVTHDASNG